jgi:hypothetical protein
MVKMVKKILMHDLTKKFEFPPTSYSSVLPYAP